MRALILTMLLMIFTAQSLALAVAPACDHQGSVAHSAHDTGMVSSAEHAHGHPAKPDGAHSGMSDHGAMPCCDDASGESAKTLCQLTCAAGGCTAVALPGVEWQLSPAPSAPAFLPISPSLLAATPRNLLRPPIGA
ncbi:hypothetical protein ACNKU7_11085 [Microbulbifer sp. SA54]|uniref:hypothetical protein n=1 Tax=Microbulbifer sp. SA54 TaxID=3401577 RepID=UPI003AACDAA2